MTVTNVALEQPEHARIMANFAFDAIEAASETLVDAEDPSKGYLQIRAGFHSGPVVTNVVGTRNQRFSIIGDTVNTASRMESNSSPGRIHCSEDSAKLIQDRAPDIDLISRGSIGVKGKGNMHTFWVQSLDTTSRSLDPSSHHVIEDTMGDKAATKSRLTRFVDQGSPKSLEKDHPTSSDDSTPSTSQNDGSEETLEPNFRPRVIKGIGIVGVPLEASGASTQESVVDSAEDPFKVSTLTAASGKSGAGESFPAAPYFT
jgi:hypothetical protein